MLPLKVIFNGRIHITKIRPIFQSCLLQRLKSTSKSGLTPSSTSGSSEVDTNVKPLGEKVKETTKTASYLGIILIGVGVAGTIFYSVFSELFSSKSPNNVYAQAAKKCINYPQVEDKLGYPITAYGEETRRGRRQHVSYAHYLDKEGRKHLRMKFHLKGSAHTGKAQLDMVEDHKRPISQRKSSTICGCIPLMSPWSNIIGELWYVCVAQFIAGHDVYRWNGDSPSGFTCSWNYF